MINPSIHSFNIHHTKIIQLPEKRPTNWFDDKNALQRVYATFSPADIPHYDVLKEAEYYIFEMTLLCTLAKDLCQQLGMNDNEQNKEKNNKHIDRFLKYIKLALNPKTKSTSIFAHQSPVQMRWIKLYFEMILNHIVKQTNQSSTDIEKGSIQGFLTELIENFNMCETGVYDELKRLYEEFVEPQGMLEALMKVKKGVVQKQVSQHLVRSPEWEGKHLLLLYETLLAKKKIFLENSTEDAENRFYDRYQIAVWRSLTGKLYFPALTPWQRMVRDSMIHFDPDEVDKHFFTILHKDLLSGLAGIILTGLIEKFKEGFALEGMPTAIEAMKQHLIQFGIHDFKIDFFYEDTSLKSNKEIEFWLMAAIANALEKMGHIEINARHFMSGSPEKLCIVKLDNVQYVELNNKIMLPSEIASLLIKYEHASWMNQFIADLAESHYIFYLSLVAELKTLDEKGALAASRITSARNNIKLTIKDKIKYFDGMQDVCDLLNKRCKEGLSQLLDNERIVDVMALATDKELQDAMDCMQDVITEDDVVGAVTTGDGENFGNDDHFKQQIAPKFIKHLTERQIALLANHFFLHQYIQQFTPCSSSMSVVWDLVKKMSMIDLKNRLRILFILKDEMHNIIFQSSFAKIYTCIKAKINCEALNIMVSTSINSDKLIIDGIDDIANLSLYEKIDPIKFLIIFHNERYFAIVQSAFARGGIKHLPTIFNSFDSNELRSDFIALFGWPVQGYVLDALTWEQICTLDTNDDTLAQDIMKLDVVQEKLKRFREERILDVLDSPVICQYLFLNEQKELKNFSPAGKHLLKMGAYLPHDSIRGISKEDHLKLFVPLLNVENAAITKKSAEILNKIFLLKESWPSDILDLMLHATNQYFIEHDFSLHGNMWCHLRDKLNCMVVCLKSNTRFVLLEDAYKGVEKYIGDLGKFFGSLPSSDSKYIYYVTNELFDYKLISDMQKLSTNISLVYLKRLMGVEQYAVLIIVLAFQKKKLSDIASLEGMFHDFLQHQSEAKTLYTILNIELSGLRFTEWGANRTDKEREVVSALFILLGVDHWNGLIQALDISHETFDFEWLNESQACRSTALTMILTNYEKHKSLYRKSASAVGLCNRSDIMNRLEQHRALGIKAQKDEIMRDLADYFASKYAKRDHVNTAAMTALKVR